MQLPQAGEELVDQSEMVTRQPDGSTLREVRLSYRSRMRQMANAVRAVPPSFFSADLGEADLGEPYRPGQPRNSATATADLKPCQICGATCGHDVCRACDSAARSARLTDAIACSNCGGCLVFSARQRGDGLCWPCSRSDRAVETAADLARQDAELAIWGSVVRMFSSPFVSAMFDSTPIRVEAQALTARQALGLDAPPEPPRPAEPAAGHLLDVTHEGEVLARLLDDGTAEVADLDRAAEVFVAEAIAECTELGEGAALDLRESLYGEAPVVVFPDGTWDVAGDYQPGPEARAFWGAVGAAFAAVPGWAWGGAR